MDASRAISLYATRLRVCRLAVSGAPLVGAENMLITDSLVKVTYEPVYTETDAVTKTNGRGELCLNVPGRKTLTGVNLSVEVCEDDPALTQMLTGGTVLTSGGDVIGYQAPKADDPAPNGLSLEVWSEAYSGGGRVADLPYYWTVFPRATLSQTSREISAAPDEKSYEGTGGENAAWGNGPANDWDYDSSACFQWVRTDTEPPAAVDGYVAVVADV